MASRSPSLLLLLYLLGAAFLALVARASELETFAFTGTSHAAFGRALGERFRDKIHARARANAKLQTRLLPFVQKTSQGRDAYARFLATHDEIFPDYMEELRGLAEGSGLPFETVFVMNLSEEFDDAVPADVALGSHAARHKTLRCSDIVLVGGPEQLRVVAHNEDADVSDVNHAAIVTATIGDRPTFVAFTYLGDLPSGAFGYNARGVAFTLNFVQPAETETGALGRGFISRDLLGASDMADAFRRIARPRQASGHNYQLMDITTARIWNIEVAAWNRMASQELLAPLNASDVTTFYHANQYQLLAIAQPPYESSLHRLRRFRELPRATNVGDALAILGDQHDRLWPVFHDAASHEKGERSGWTLTTVVFDLHAKRAVSYRGNPKRQQQEFVWDLVNMTVTKVADEAQTLA